MPSTYTQLGRPLFATFEDMEDDDLLLESFEGIDQISTPFHFKLILLSERDDIDITSMIRKSVTLGARIENESDDFRLFNGKVRAGRLISRDANLVRYEVEMVSWNWFLTLYTHCRIFQNMTAIDIVSKVFKDCGFNDFSVQTTATPPVREYCVQYRETNFNFVSRLLEEEGIYYYFEHEEKKHTLVMVNDKASLKPCPTVPKLRYEQGTGFQEPDVITAWTQHYAARTEQVFLKDFDFQQPRADLKVSCVGEAHERMYDYPGDYTQLSNGEKLAQIRLEEQEVHKNVAYGSSISPYMTAGFKFDLKEHFRRDLNQTYTLVSVQHRGVMGSYRAGEEEFKYTNTFSAIPYSVPFRPPRTAKKPRVEGTQTAEVVTPSGEEIYCDSFGRVKVHFYWDLEGKYDGNDSCWVRVSQAWAGKGWGFITMPRRGQEVIVDFLEGDPDRPIVVGRVYNASETVPYALPDKQTVSTFKSMSSKGGGGFNEFRFEDAKGSEQIFMHAEKNLDLRVKNDRMEHIMHDAHLTVDNDQFIQVGRDEQVQIERHQYTSISQEHHVTVGNKMTTKVGDTYSLKISGNTAIATGGNYHVNATGDLYLQSGGTLVIEAITGITMKIPGSTVVLTPEAIMIDSLLVKLNCGGSPGSGTSVSPVTPLMAGAPKDADDATPGQNDASSGAGYSYTVSEHSWGKKLGGGAAGAGRTAPASSDDPTHQPDPEKQHWVQVQLVDEAGKPVSGEYYRIKLPDGSVAEGTTNDEGLSPRIDGIDPGQCEITFPNLDQEAWEPL